MIALPRGFFSRVEVVSRLFVSVHLSSICLVILCSGNRANAQCATFSAQFCPPGVSGSVRAMAEYDDGHGNALYAGGIFSTAGSTVAQSIARWDGSHWQALGLGIEGGVNALAVFDDGTGPALFVGGLIQKAGGMPVANIAKWNGSVWSAVGPGVNSSVAAMVVHNDGTGPALCVAGPLLAGSVQLYGLGKWNGTSWSSIGGGISNRAYALAVHDFGAGNRLVVGGDFVTAGGVSAFNIAVWNGTVWSTLGMGFSQRVHTLATYNSELIVGGEFYPTATSAALKVARWTGSAWQTLGSGLDNVCYTLRVEDLGSGSKLYAGGNFLNSGAQAVRRLAQWDGVSWSEVGGGSDGGVWAIRAFPTGFSPSLFVGGTLQELGGVSLFGIGRWNGSWSGVTDRGGNGANGTIYTTAVANLGQGPRLYCGGTFTRVGSAAARRMASWDGASWSALGTGVGPVSSGEVDAMVAHDDGSGMKLYVGGDFYDPTLTIPSYIAAWNGSVWSWVGFGTNNGVKSLAVFDEGAGPKLFVGGYFSDASGIPALRVARWNGTTWSAVGGGTNDIVYALAVFDDGGGSALFAGGNFTTAGGTPCAYLAKWNGVQWSPITPGFNGSVQTLRVLDDGNGPALYALGNFTTAGGVAVNGIARLKNGTWSALGSGPALQSSLSIGAFDDGSGPAIYVGGYRSGSADSLSTQIAKWDGATWTMLPEALSNPTETLVAVRDFRNFDPGAGNGPSMFVAGTFAAVGAIPSAYIAEYRGCAAPFLSECSGDGSGTPCPCGNSGMAGHGCANAVHVDGTQLQASGTPRVVADSLVLTTTSAVNGPGLFFQGSISLAAGLGVTFGNGLQCAGGAIARLGIVTASGDTAQFPRPGLDPAISMVGACSPGDARTYQVWYRDADPLFCTGSGFNLTNGVRLTWRP